MNIDRKKIAEYLEPGKKNLFLIYTILFAAIISFSFVLFGICAIFAYFNQQESIQPWSSHYKFIIKNLKITAIFYFAFYILINSLTLFYPAVSVLHVAVYMIIFFWLFTRSVVSLRMIVNDTAYTNFDSWWV